jgi:hypothetical protein
MPTYPPPLSLVIALALVVALAMGFFIFNLATPTPRDHAEQDAEPTRSPEDDKGDDAA